MFEHLPKQRDLAGKEGGVAENSGRGVSVRPLVHSQRARRQLEALGRAWARLGAHSHSTPRAVGASVYAGERQDERAKANCCGSLSHLTGGRKTS